MGKTSKWNASNASKAKRLRWKRVEKSGLLVVGEMPVVGSDIVTKATAIAIMTGNARVELYAETTIANIFMDSIAKVLIEPMIAAKSLREGNCDKSSDCGEGLVGGSNNCRSMVGIR